MNETPLDTKQKIATAQKQLIRDSRKLINILKPLVITMKRQGEMRSLQIPVGTLDPDREVLDSYMSVRKTPEFLMSCIGLNITCDESKVSEIQQRAARTLTTLGYHREDITARAKDTAIIRKGYRLDNPKLVRVGKPIKSLHIALFDYAIRPVYQGGLMRFDSERFPYLRSSYYVWKVGLPIFDDTGHYTKQYKEMEVNEYRRMVGLEQYIFEKPPMPAFFLERRNALRNDDELCLAETEVD